MKRVLILIRSLECGGAERQLIELIKALDKSRFKLAVATFYGQGALAQEFMAVEGVQVISLGKRRRWDLFPFLWNLWNEARIFRPDIIYGYMNVSAELSLLLGKVLRAKVVWGLRTANLELSIYDWAVRWSFRIGAWLSRFPDLIIVNSWAGKRYYAALGYCDLNMVVVPNGIDCDRFHPDRALGVRMREAWGITGNEILIGLAGRLDPIKGHSTFLRAAAGIAHARPDVRFACVGVGASVYESELHALASELNLDSRLLWVKGGEDMNAVYNAFDIAVSASLSEGFSNVIAEAMACGIPCIATDVGDSAVILGDTGLVVPARNHEELARAMMIGMTNLLSEADRATKRRERIVENFSPERLAFSTAVSFDGLFQNHV
jgi:glycosyltransferase involved in cell wall biosynthesis